MWVMLAMAALGQAVPVDEKLVDGLPVQTVTLVVHGTTQQCSGPMLADVLNRLGAPAGNDVRADALRLILLAKARDGYQVAFTLGELDPLLGNKRAIIATQCDGKPLAAEDGPYRLVMADEKRGARSLRQLETLTLLNVE